MLIKVNIFTHQMKRTIVQLLLQDWEQAKWRKKKKKEKNFKEKKALESQ